LGPAITNVKLDRLSLPKRLIWNSALPGCRPLLSFVSGPWPTLMARSIHFLCRLLRISHTGLVLWPSRCRLCASIHRATDGGFARCGAAGLRAAVGRRPADHIRAVSPAICAAANAPRPGALGSDLASACLAAAPYPSVGLGCDPSRNHRPSFAPTTNGHPRCIRHLPTSSPSIPNSGERSSTELRADLQRRRCW
jgi:hypothetical protein